jgi:hypothetical protein
MIEAIVLAVSLAIPAAEAKTLSDGQSDFDFLFGRWKVHNRRLRERLKGSTTWDEFEGTVVARPVWGGKGNIDEYEAVGPAGPIQGLTLRLFDPRSRQWSIHWSTSATGVLDTPMIGSFKDGRGEFYDQEMFEGRSIYVRFIWSRMTPTACRWEQAFSADGGQTWETNWIMDFTREAEAARERECCAVVELRRYVMKPGRRDDLVALFEKHFIEGQETDDMRILGTFTDRQEPDRFVWMRAFPGMEARRQALEDFYGGPLWKEHSRAANDTMVDVSDVLLLKPAGLASGPRGTGLAPDGSTAPGGIVVATIYHFAGPVDARFVDFFESGLSPALSAAGARLQAQYVTEPAENTFPRLPVRQGENVFVWIASFADEAAYAAYQARLQRDRKWTESLLPALQSWLAKPPQVLELTPTRRSRLRH